VRRIGVLMGYAESDAGAQLRLAAFKQGLTMLGWTEGRELTLDVRWIAGEINRAAGRGVSPPNARFEQIRSASCVAA
jgi:hypothetical protein